MKQVLIALIIPVLIFATSLWYVKTASICPVPISYKVGEVDDRFGVKKEELKKVVAEAEAVWEEAVGRELFIYDEESSFAINFIYDERQQLASTEEEWRIDLDRQEQKSKEVIDQVKKEGEVYEAMQAEYLKDRTAYEERLVKYNERVESFNNQGGAPEPAFSELQDEQRELSKLVNRLTRTEKELNEKIEEINELGEKGNKLIEEYNAEVLQYNEVFGNRDLYTQGDFQRDRINIYKFNDNSELVKVIAHEFGHSLGIGHVEGDDSIMYYLMAEQPERAILTDQDKQMFFVVCGNGDGLSYQIRDFIRSILSFL